jgi:hypothetical protein
MTLKQRQTMLAPQLSDQNSASPGAGDAGTTIDRQFHSVQRVRVTLDAVVVSITAALDYGSAQLLDFQDRNIMILQCETNVEMTKGNLSTGIVAATDLDVGLGSEPASAQTLATTMINIIEKQDEDAADLTPAALYDMSAQATAIPASVLPDSATSGVYWNIGLPTPVTVDDTVSLTGTVDLVFIDLGNENS